MERIHSQGPSAYAAYCAEMERLAQEPAFGSISGARDWGTLIIPTVPTTGHALTAATANLPLLDRESHHSHVPINDQTEQRTDGDGSSYILMASRTGNPETGEIQWHRIRRELTTAQNAKERFSNRVFALGCLTFVGLTISAAGLIRWIAE